MTSRFGLKGPERDVDQFEDAAVRALREQHIALAHAVIDALPDSREAAESIRMLDNSLGLAMRAIKLHGIRGGG